MHRLLLLFCLLGNHCHLLEAQTLTNWVAGEFRLKASGDSIKWWRYPPLMSRFPRYYYYTTSMGVLNDAVGNIRALSTHGFVADTQLRTLYYCPGFFVQPVGLQNDMFYAEGNSIFLLHNYQDSIETETHFSIRMRLLKFDTAFKVQQIIQIKRKNGDIGNFVPAGLLAITLNGKHWVISRSYFENDFLVYNLDGKLISSSNCPGVNYFNHIEVTNGFFNLSPDFNYLVHHFKRELIIPSVSTWGRSDILHIMRFNPETGQIVHHSNLDTAMSFEGSCFNSAGKYLYTVCVRYKKGILGFDSSFGVLRQYNWEKYLKTGQRIYNEYKFPLNTYTIDKSDNYQSRGLIYTSNNLIAGSLGANGFFWIKNPDTFTLKNNIEVRTQNALVTGFTATGWPTQPAIQKFNDPVVFNWDSAWNLPDPVFHLWVPEAFSPNNSNLNDSFFIKTNIPLESAAFKVSVFNRYGVKIYESFEPNFRWDGRYKAEILSDGVFSVVINYQNPITKELKFKSTRLLILQ